MKRTMLKSLQVMLMAVLLLLMMVGQPAIAQGGTSINTLLNDYTVAVATATVKTQKSNYAANEQIIVEYSGFPGNKNDWITISSSDKPDNSYGPYFYTQGKQNGTYTFNGLPAGNYQVRSYFNWPAGGYTVQTRSSFTVGDTAVAPPTTKPGTCLEGDQATLIDFNKEETVNGKAAPISSGGVTISFEGLNVIEVGQSQGGFGGQAGPNQVIASDQGNFNGRFLTEPGNRAAYRPINYRRAITFSEPVNHLCLYMADIDSGQGINLKVLNAQGESLYTKAFPSSTGADASLTKLDLSQLKGIKTIEMIGDDPIGIDNLTFSSVATEPKPEPTPIAKPEPTPEPTPIAKPEPTPEPNPCDPNKPIPGAFSSIRLGDFDGFGFKEGQGLKAAYGGTINVDGTGTLSTGDFLPDFNGDGKFSNRDAGDPFDNRSDAEVVGTSLTGDGFEDMGSKGSDYTDVFLGKAFGYKSSSTYGHSFPDGDPNTLPNTPGFKFHFKVAKAKLPQGTPLFLNVMLGDYDVEPVQVIFKGADGQTVTKDVIASAKGDKDGIIQASYVPLEFDQVFSDGDVSGEAGYWVGYFDVDFDAPNEPTLAFDFAEIGTKQIPLTPCPQS
ncbi:hypothetical protein [Crocosphaera sp. XPORK-15E]|uniref:hypothetical protein n=1 Tax=Crocosphaera sp. XPORK-15E TaxID=3110247 RepID=UPI002B1EA2B4|nr:hypothetical protein [Crocosphaera sp. XPORK-15E]MEA5532390.1 hypothetical protein [Crocosphaera sp. XPORK-15E]